MTKLKSKKLGLKPNTFSSKNTRVKASDTEAVLRNLKTFCGSEVEKSNKTCHENKNDAACIYESGRISALMDILSQLNELNTKGSIKRVVSS